jgi:hypothetical protein
MESAKCHCSSRLNPNLATTASQSRDVRTAASVLGREVHVFHASTESDIERAFVAIDQMRVGGMLIEAGNSCVDRDVCERRGYGGD